MREEIDKACIEPNMWNDGKKAAMAYVPLLEVFMKQYEEGKNEEAAGNAFYLLERLARLHCKDVDYFLSQIERVIARILSFYWRLYAIS